MTHHLIHHLTLPWGRLAYTDTGAPSGDATTPPILLLPGSGCDIDDWHPMLDAMPHTFRGRIIALDFRAHGQSSAATEPFTCDDLADDVLALIDHLQLKRPILAGHSLGGMVAMLVADRSPNVAGLVLLEGWTCGSAGEAFGPEHELGQLPAPARALIQRKLDATLARCRPGVWQRLGESCTAFDARPFLARAAIPVTHVYGDHACTPATLGRLQIPPNPRMAVVWVPGSGHYLPHEKPRECAAAIAKAIAGHC
ncbi:MAG: alpha/beta fold hydrolase [Planctomycetota bacterium]|nr:alpha/beta fold hydrolase [Planctomycetota bacterium]